MNGGSGTYVDSKTNETKRWENWDNIRIITQPKGTYDATTDKPIIRLADSINCEDETANVWLEGANAPYTRAEGAGDDDSIWHSGFKVWAEQQDVYLPENIKVDRAYSGDSCVDLTSHVKKPVDFGKGGFYNSYYVHAQSWDKYTTFDYNIEFPK